MREIKFRAWDKENNQWYAPRHEAYRWDLWELLVDFSGELSAHTVDGLGNRKLEHQSLWPDRYALMQFTGLRDKNGKEIYEGDIVKAEDGVWEVQWRDAENLALVNDLKEGISVKHADNTYCLGETEVIGNVHENPELLEEK